MRIQVLKRDDKPLLYIYITVFILLFNNIIHFLQDSIVQAIALSVILALSYVKNKMTSILWYTIFFLISSFSFLFCSSENVILTMVNTLFYISIFNFLCIDNKHINNVFEAMSVIGGIMFVYIIITYFSILGYGRLGDHLEDTTFDNSIRFSYYIIAIICSSLVVINKSSSSALKMIAIVSIILGFIIAIFNGAKKGYIVPLFFILMYTFVKNKSNAIKLTIKITILIIAVSVIWNQIKDIDILQRYFVNRVESMIATFSNGIGADDDGSTSARMSYIPVAFNKFIDSPIWGMGGLGFSSEYFMKVIKVSHPHNDFLNMLAAGGLVLFFIYYWFPFKILKSCFHAISKNKEAGLMFSLIVSLLFNNFNSSTFNIPVINFFYAVLYRYLIINRYYK